MKDAASIHCEVTGKLLARRNAEGIYLWCKMCKTEHFVPWIDENKEGQKSDKLASEHTIRKGDFTLILDHLA